MIHQLILTVLGIGFLERLLCNGILDERNKSVPEFTVGGDSPLLLLYLHIKKLTL
mgnify:CR=1 FL=1